jgi:hypothetical protein
MRQIYQKASRVIVWLESAESTWYETSTTLNLLYLVSIAKTGLFLSLSKLRQDYMGKPRGRTGAGRWRGLNKLLRHEWFGRVWMVQEIVVASKIHAIYGGAYLDWDMFSNTMHTLSNIEMTSVVWSAGETSTIGQTGAPLAILHTITMADLRRRFSDGKPITLKDGLLACNRFEATKDVDKIYSLQAFVTEELDQRLLANYENESVETLYLDTAQHLLDQDYIVDILPLAGIGHGRTYDKLPSWAVDWSRIPIIVQFSGGKVFQKYWASGSSTSSIHITAKRGRIVLRGFKTDGISELGPKLIHDPKLMESPEAHIESIKKIFKFYREAESISESSIIGRLREDSFWRTLIGDRVSTDGTQPQSQQPAPDDFSVWNESFRIMSRMAESRSLDLVLESGNPWVERDNAELTIMSLELILSLSLQGLSPDDLTKHLMEAYKFLPSMGSACTNRMFCTTKGGFLALAPPQTKQGDIVFIPLGAQAPFVLRYHAEEEVANIGKKKPVYKLVGECYVHGMMDGEMMSNHPEIEDLILE